MHANVATSGALAAPRVQLPSTRRHGTGAGLWRPFSTALTIVLLLLLGGVWLVPPVWILLILTFGLWTVTLPAMTTPVAHRHRATNQRALASGALFAAGGIGALLVVPSLGYCVVLAPLWVFSAILLYRGLGQGSDSTWLRLLAALSLAAALTWLNLLVTLQEVRVQSGPYAHMGPIEVFAGWPFADCVGFVRGGMRSDTPGLSTVVWQNYAVMLGLAALALLPPRWRTPTFLATWLPRVCCGLAVVQMFGGIRLALAIDG